MVSTPGRHLPHQPPHNGARYDRFDNIKKPSGIAPLRGSHQQGATMTATVINLTKRRADLIEHQDRAYLAQIFAAPAYMALPFVTLKKDTDGLGAWSEGESYWNDVPTDDGCADHERGRAYAQMAIAALASDCRSARGLELTLEHMFLDAVRRREKGGKYSRSLASAARAFLNELARHINEGVGGRLVQS
jgi:hypothetical protein